MWEQFPCHSIDRMSRMVQNDFRLGIYHGRTGRVRCDDKLRSSDHYSLFSMSGLCNKCVALVRHGFHRLGGQQTHKSWTLHSDQLLTNDKQWRTRKFRDRYRALMEIHVIAVPLQTLTMFVISCSLPPGGARSIMESKTGESGQ